MKKKILTISSICALALFMVGCKDKNKTKNSKTTATPTTVKPTTVKPTTAKPTTTESIEKYKVNETTFNTFFQYDFDGLKDVNFEGELIRERDSRVVTDVTMIVADGRNYMPAYKTISYMYSEASDKYGMNLFTKRASGDGYDYTDSFGGVEFKELCFGYYLPILDYSKVTFDETKKCYVSSEEIITTSTPSEGTTNTTKFYNIEIKFYDNKPVSITCKEDFSQKSEGVDLTETSTLTFKYTSFGTSTVDDPEPGLM